MAPKNTYEDRRLALQAELDGHKTQAERNVLGQFATPTALAREVLRFAISKLPPSEDLRFLDPAIGTGSFFSALRVVAPAKRIASVDGFEVDHHYGEPAKKLWVKTALNIHLEDFTTALPPEQDEKRSNLLICNPPYVRHHHLVNDEKTRLQDATEQACGVRIARLAGLYCYFLGLSHSWMSDDGVAAWLIPSEFMDVNYGKAVKRYLLEKVTLLRIHRFNPNDVQFDDALVSSAVVFFRKSLPKCHHKVEFSFGGTLLEPAVLRQVSILALREEAKWTRFPLSEERQKHTGITLGDLFQVKRGIATGDNKFFILTPEQIAEKELPRQFFRPILPSPRYLPVDHVKADKDGNPVLDKRLFLLDCRLPEDEIKAKHSKLWTYLESGKPEVSDRYLCKHRKVWYFQEDRPPAPFVCTYLGRGDKKNGRPFRFILNESKATAANVYLFLYPKSSLAEALEKHPSLARKVWSFLNTIDPKSMLDEGRVYGGGLHKMEPKELANVPADELAELLDIDPRPARQQQNLFEACVA